jgi:hypothetical protein
VICENCVRTARVSRQLPRYIPEGSCGEKPEDAFPSSFTTVRRSSSSRHPTAMRQPQQVVPATLGDFAGIPISIRVRDNGTSVNDPPDQASFFFWNSEDLCTDTPDYELFKLVAGQVQITEF